MKNVTISALQKSETTRACVCISANPTLEGADFCSLGFFLSPDAARTLAIDILKAADKTDGGKGWQERLADALATKFDEGHA